MTVFRLIHAYDGEYLGQGADDRDMPEGTVFCTFDGWFRVERVVPLEKDEWVVLFVLPTMRPSDAKRI